MTTDPTTTPTNEQQDVRGAAFGVTPGKPYPEHLYPGCPCAACDQRNVMNLCPTCGNKRCPAAMDHARWACSGSNEPGHAPAPLAAVSAAAPDERDEMDGQWARVRAWREHVATKRSHRQARRSSFDAGWDAALAACPGPTAPLVDLSPATAPVVNAADVERAWSEGERAGEAFANSQWQWSAGATSRLMNGIHERPERPINPYRLTVADEGRA